MNDQGKMMMSMGKPPVPVMSQPPQQVQNPPMFMNQLMMNQPQSQGMLNHRGGGGGGYGMWPPPPQQMDQLKFQNPNMKHVGFVPNSSKPMAPRNHKMWKGKKGNDKWNNNNRKELPPMGGSSGISGGVGGGGGGYNPPTLKELQQQNRLKARRYFSKKKFNHGGRSAPFAPRNTTSFLIRAKKSGGITSLVSPCPVTPAVLPTPIFSPSREVLVDMAKEEWGVDGYGSMKGLIRLRSPGNDAEDEEEEDGGSSESDVEEHVEVERRLDHDLSRFEMIYPNADHSSYLLENRVDDQDTHIAQLEEENLILKERLFLMEREFDDLRMRLHRLERHSQGAVGFNEEVVGNDSENESESRGCGRSTEENNEAMEENNGGNQYSEALEEGNMGDAELKESNTFKKSEQAMQVGINVESEVKGMESNTIEENLKALEIGVKLKSEAKSGIDLGRNVDMSKAVGITDVHMEEHIQDNEGNNNVNINSQGASNIGTAEPKEENNNAMGVVLDQNAAVSSNVVETVDKEESLGAAKDEVTVTDGFKEDMAGNEN